jgi:hypothetical protein
VATEPDQMTIPVNGPLTDEYRIDISWSPMSSPANGDSAITSYDLQYDNATSGFIWYSIIGLSPDSLALSYRVTTGVVPGRTYRFRVRARNAFGWGDLSTYLAIKSATLPDRMIQPVTSIDATTGSLRISWLPPHDGSDTITKYTVQIMLKGQSIGQEVTQCDGIGSQLTTRTCLVPMSLLTSSPFNYVFDDLVTVRTTSTNFFGTPIFSNVNIVGGKIRYVPGKMNAPFLVSRTKTTMTVRWVPIVAPATGNSPVITYNLYWDNGLGDITIELADSLITEYTITGLTGGTFYKYQVRASNIYGYGVPSDVTDIEASDVPDVMAIISTSIVGTKFKFEWAPPFDNFDPIDKYELMIRKADGIFYRDAVNCPGEPASDTSCFVEMDTLRIATGL